MIRMNRKILLLLFLTPQFIYSVGPLWLFQPYHDPFSGYDHKTCAWLLKWHEKEKKAEQKAKEAEVEKRAVEFFRQKEQEHENKATQNELLGQVLITLRTSVQTTQKILK